MGAEGRRQNIREATVSILRVIAEDNPSSWETVGTGFIVSKEAHIVTCRHVVEGTSETGGAGLVIGDPAQRIGIRFPFAVGESKYRLGRVHKYLSSSKDDVVVLETLGDNPVLPNQVVELGESPTQDEEFSSYGYRKLGPYPAANARGKLLGPMEAPPGEALLAEPIQIDSNQIDHGMSGAGVLEHHRNLVVGIIAATYYPDAGGKDRDLAWAVDAKVLGASPFNLPLAHTARPLDPAPILPPTAQAAVARTAAPPPVGGFSPDMPSDWVGRESVLASLAEAWDDGDCGSLVIVGIGGEGKSAAVRKWVSDLPELTDRPPVSVFWWTFGPATGPDQFLDHALIHFSGESHPGVSAYAKAGYLAAAVERHPCVVVLDGFESIQRHDLDSYGAVASEPIYDFISFFGRSGVSSLCVVTTRIPLLDLSNYVMMRHINLDRLGPHEARSLLAKSGVKGPQYLLDELVEAWDGHALTLTLLSTLGAEGFEGDVRHLLELTRTRDLGSSQHKVHQVLAWYDDVLTETEQALLMALCIAREPIAGIDIESYLCAVLPPNSVTARSALCDPRSFARLQERLKNYGILESTSLALRLHPSISSYYYDRLRRSGEILPFHRAAANWYLNSAPRQTDENSLSSLSPLVEAVYHLCRAGDYTVAYETYSRELDRGQGRLQYQLGAYVTDLRLLEEFFPSGSERTPSGVMGDPLANSYLLRTRGLGRMAIGRLAEASKDFEASEAAATTVSNWDAAGRAAQVLSEVDLHLGRLHSAVRRAQYAASLYARQPDTRRSTDLDDQAWGVQNSRLHGAELATCCQAYEAWSLHLHGEVRAAQLLFEAATRALHDLDPRITGLRDLWGIYHADHLVAEGELVLARRLTQLNLEYAVKCHVTEVVSQCHRVLGDLEVASGDYRTAKIRYDKALTIAGVTDHRPAKIEAQLALGRWLRADHDLGSAETLLLEAMDTSRWSGYRIYEIDALVALGGVALAGGDSVAAHRYGTQAGGAANAIGYRSGQLAATDLVSLC
jgi:tetratricopeptide (TPR) repeat protein